MATPAAGGLKGFYRQRKKDAGVVKPPPKKRPKNAKPRQCADIQQGATAAADGADDCGAEELELRRFDMDMTYGPCIGVTRLRRWERAAAMGLSPPPHLRDLIVLQQQSRDDLPPLLDRDPSSPPKSSIDNVNGGRGINSISLECLWAGNV